VSELVIFGNKELAEVAHFYFSRDTERKVRAFTVDDEYADQDSFLGLPVIPFSELTRHYPPEQFDLFVAVGYTKINQVRKDKYLQCKTLGYKLPTYISSRAIWWTDNIPGDNCFILESVVVQPFVRIGNNVTIWSASHVGHHALIKDHTFVTSHVVIGGGAVIGEQSFIGINATVRDHISLGDRCIVGAGASVMENAAEDALYIEHATKCATRSSTAVRL